MTQVARLFPHLPEPASPPGAGASPTPPITGTRPAGGLKRPQVPLPSEHVPTDLPKITVPEVGKKDLQRLGRLISVLETNPALYDRVGSMPGMNVLRQHFQMQCALEGLLRGLIKE